MCVHRFISISICIYFWTWWHELKPLMRLSAFHLALTVFVLQTTSSLQFSFLRHWHIVYLLNPFSWGQRDHSWKILNLESMKYAVKLSTQMKRLFFMSWCLCVVRHCHTERGQYRSASWGLTPRIRGLSHVRV